jgi:hypothetical protein
LQEQHHGRKQQLERWWEELSCKPQQRAACTAAAAVDAEFSLQQLRLQWLLQQWLSCSL